MQKRKHCVTGPEPACFGLTDFEAVQERLGVLARQRRDQLVTFRDPYHIRRNLFPEPDIMLDQQHRRSVCKDQLLDLHP